MQATDRFWVRVASLILAAGFVSGHAAPAHGAEAPQAIQAVSHRPKQPHSGEAVKITATVPATMTNVTLQYQFVDPGKYIDLKDAAYKTNWISLLMTSLGKGNENIC